MSLKIRFYQVRWKPGRATAYEYRLLNASQDDPDPLAAA
jgi:hypothetical protein